MSCLGKALGAILMVASLYFGVLLFNAAGEQIHYTGTHNSFEMSDQGRLELILAGDSVTFSAESIGYFELIGVATFVGAEPVEPAQGQSSLFVISGEVLEPGTYTVESSRHIVKASLESGQPYYVSLTPNEDYLVATRLKIVFLGAVFFIIGLVLLILYSSDD